MSKPFFKRKTTWASIGTIVAAIGALVVGEAELGTTIMTVGGALVAMFLRDAINPPA
jgi:hypothetical protein